MAFLTHTSLRNFAFITFKIIPQRVPNVIYLKLIHQWVQLWPSYTRKHNAQNEKERIASHFFQHLSSFQYIFSPPVMFIFSGLFPHHYHCILFYSSLPGSALYYFIVVLDGQKLFLQSRIDCFSTGVSEISREVKI